MRYQGDYKNNLKNGKGQIVNDDGSIAFSGIFVNNMPEGSGYATDN